MKKLLVILLFVAVLPVADVRSEETKVQTHCPICKMEINKELFADYKGERVYFGCEGCLPVFKKDPAKIVRQMKAEGIKLAKTPVKKEKHSHNHKDGHKHNHKH